MQGQIQEGRQALSFDPHSGEAPLLASGDPVQTLQGVPGEREACCGGLGWDGGGESGDGWEIVGEVVREGRKVGCCGSSGGLLDC